ncbi:2-hydroxyacid dehydrogenase [Amphritea balenae]|uniref:Glyoxylate/hydroxypyruvate reductase A n=1 Tax=Amphritea balenae TaxID=452629 RepID=A0A3P1SQ95_9GAMM|nr:glyoxylate/hydroxypyruvate reductase A [Amphritea balenae]RRC99307.1 glyoxylate/hydroxypyruvate reductase A [Amphritea balenae]GGK72154.1 glyoxylate/hydroxypyruvate reductase A [Amphritea balenae]
MRPLIPFVHQIDIQEAKDWLNALQVKLPDCDIRLFNQLTEQEREQAELAIVANPASSDVALLPNLKWVHSVWAGVEGMMAELAHMPFDIVRLVDPNLAQTMSEAVLAWVMYLHRDMPGYRAQQALAHWQQQPYVEPADRQIVILGLGELGLKSAARLVENGFQVSGWSRSLKAIDGVPCYAGEQGLAETVGQADIIVNLLPLTAETKGLMNSGFFAELKQGASLINFGRGATIDQSDLISALAEGQLYHAVLDVFAQEPLVSDSELWANPDITILPHISAPTSVNSASVIVAENIRRYLVDGTMPLVVDKQRGY